MNTAESSSPLPLGATARPPLWLGLGLGFLVFLLARPYLGMLGDGQLYVGELLRRVHPALNADPYFAHGSQGRYSIYAFVMTPLYQALTIETVQLLVLGLALVASGCAVYRLLREQGSLQAWMGLFCLLGLSSAYGGMATLKYFEGCLTARTLAEPLVLWGLVLLLKGRRLGAVLCLLAAAAFHPLIALPAWVIAWLELRRADKRWNWALLTIPAVLLLAWAGVHPFDGLFHRYDSAWWELVSFIDRHILYANWTLADWQRTLIDALLLLMARAWAPPRMARLAESTLFAGVALSIVSAVGADLAHSQLITSLQLWRVLWLVHLLALSNLPLVLGTLWQRETSLGLWRLTALLAACTVVASDGGYPQALGALVMAAGIALAAQRQVRVGRGVLRLAAGGAILCMLGLGAANAYHVSDIWRSGYYDPLIPPAWVLLLRMPALILPASFIALRIWQQWPSKKMGPLLIVPFLALALLAVGSQWDRRSDWTKLLERGGLVREHPFDQLIEPTAQVYWHQDLVPPWLLLGRPMYYGEGQAAGVLFNEGMARDFGARWMPFRPMLESTQVCRVFAGILKWHETQCSTPAPQVVRTLCAKSAQLDYLVFSGPIGGGPGPKNDSPAPLSVWDPHLPAQTDLKFYLYGCRQFR